MVFKVDSDAVRGLASCLAGLYADTFHLRSYVEQWVDVEYSDGRMFAMVKPVVDDARQVLLNNCEQLASLTSLSSQQLHLAATYYEETDEESARSLDECC